MPELATTSVPDEHFAREQLPGSAADWFAVYTCPRHEKRVKRQLELRHIRCALPLYRALHRWKDRRKEVELPLFPSYILSIWNTGTACASFNCRAW